MKYVSPQTEKRKKQQQKRRKQLTLIGAAVIVVVILVLLAVSLVKNTSSSSGESDGQTSSIVQSENGDESLSQNDSSTSAESQDSQVSLQPQKTKKSIFQKIAEFFSGEEEIAVTFPATSFGRQIDTAADEIISLSPLATEVILSSASQHSLVAVSEYCNKRGNELMTVGTPLIPKTDKIIQLAPDYLIVQNPLSEQDKIKIEQSGITVLQLNAPDSFEELKEIYRSVIALTQGADIAAQKSESIIADIQEKLSLYQVALTNVDKKSAVMLFNGYGMVATQDTFEAELLSNFFDVEIAGNNYFTEGLESVIASNPQVLIVSDLMTAEQLTALGFAETDAFVNGNVYYVSIQDFENISAKCIKTLSGIANSVYGNAIQPALPSTAEAES